MQLVNQEFTMRNISHAILVALVVCLIVTTTRGELPPRAYDEFKRAAEDVLIVTVLGVETSEQSADFDRVSARFKITRVERSKTGHKVEAEIKVNYSMRKPGRPPVVGPASLPLVARGEAYRVYLNGLAPAALGRSFERLETPATAPAGS